MEKVRTVHKDCSAIRYTLENVKLLTSTDNISQVQYHIYDGTFVSCTI